jgi:site-specific recombinase XerC
LLYKETKDLKAVQDELGHANISTSAIYADSGHEVERYSERVPLHFNKD